MTSSNGNIFRVTGHLCGEFTSDRWIPLTKASDLKLDIFFDLHLKNRLCKQSKRRSFETASRSLWRHCNVQPPETFRWTKRANLFWMSFLEVLQLLFRWWRSPYPKQYWPNSVRIETLLRLWLCGTQCIKDTKPHLKISFVPTSSSDYTTLHWRHNYHDDVSNQQPPGCLLNRLFRRRSKKTSKLRRRHWPLCGEFAGTGEFPAQRAINAENVSISWRHHDFPGSIIYCD